MKQVSIMTKNKPGELASVCEALEKRGINITTIFGGGMDHAGMVHLITEDENSAKKAFEHAGYKVDISDIITVKLMDKAGELAKVARKLAFAGVNINWIYLLTRTQGEVTLAMQVNDIKKAQAAIK